MSYSRTGTLPLSCLHLSLQRRPSSAPGTAFHSTDVRHTQCQSRSRENGGRAVFREHTILVIPKARGRGLPKGGRKVYDPARAGRSRVSGGLAPAGSQPTLPEMVKQCRLPRGAGPRCVSSPAPVGPGLADPPNTAQTAPRRLAQRQGQVPER